MRWIALLSLMAVSASATAQYRCVENGKTVYTDRPCPLETKPIEQPPRGNAPKIIGDPGNSAYGSPYGTWRGQIQYQMTSGGGVNPAAMAVVAMTMDIDPQGPVVGGSPGNGCRFKGIASPGGTPALITLDLTFSGCNFSGYNQRLFGTLVLNSAQKHAQFSLHGSHVAPFASLSFFDIKGTLRR